MIIYSYSMIHIKAVDKITGPNVSSTALQQKDKSVRDSIKSVALKAFVDSKRNPNIPQDHKRHVAWHDKQNLSKMKDREKMEQEIQTDPTANTFPDIEHHKYQSDIEIASINGIINGHFNGKFYPDNDLKYADLLSMLQNTYKAAYNKEISTMLLEELIALNKKPNDCVSYTEFTNILASLQNIRPKIKTLDELGLYQSDQKVTRAQAINTLISMTDLRTNTYNPEAPTWIVPDTVVTMTENLWNSYISNMIEMGIIDEFHNSVSNPLASITREEFIAWTVKFMQKHNDSIPEKIGNIDYFADITSENQYFNEISIAKINWLTSFFETIHRNETYLQPQKNVTLYEANTMLHQLNNEVIVNKSQDVDLVSYEKAAMLLLGAITEQPHNEEKTTVHKEDTKTTEALWEKINDPWIVQTIKPYVKKAVEMR